MIESNPHTVTFTDVTNGETTEMIAGGKFEIGDLFRPISQDLVFRVVDIRTDHAFPALRGNTLDGRHHGTFRPTEIIGLNPREPSVLTRYCVARPVVNMQILGGPSWYYVEAENEEAAEAMAVEYEEARDWPTQPEKGDPHATIVGVRAFGLR